MRKRMPKNYEVVETGNNIKPSYIKVACFRNARLKSEISAFKWFILTLVEFVVGAEILENIINSGSVHPEHKKDDSYKYGNELHLSLHIPSGLITNLLSKQIIELLYYKFYLQYLILEPVSEPVINDAEKQIDCSRTRFRARKNLFYEFIAFRRVYDLFWLIANLSIDAIVLLATTDIQLALLSAFSVEAFRRILRI
jgi:hypothetical protein